MLCALGTCREEAWKNMVEGRCGIDTLTLFDPTGYRSPLVAEIPDYRPRERFTPRQCRRMSRSDQVAVLATAEALDDSQLLQSGIDPLRVGVVLGSGTADLLRNEEYYGELLERGIDRAPLSKIFNHFASTPIDVVGSHFGMGGLSACMVSACSSGTVAIGYAGDLIQGGRLDAAVCGASDVLCRLTLSGFNALRLVSLEPCRPFDIKRDGLNIGEAGAVLVLEDMERAMRRGAKIYAELAGSAAGCEAYHPPAPEPDGRTLTKVMLAALDAARTTPDAVDHINSHGTATPHNDRAEARAILSAFGERGRKIPVNSIKSMVGHCLGAAGAIEAAALALTIYHGLIPPTVNHEEKDPECDIHVVSAASREVPVSCGVSNSLAFGGNDAALVMKRVG